MIPFFRKRTKARAITAEDFFGRSLPGGGRITPERCAKLAAVFAAVRLVSESISSLPIAVVERGPDGLRRRVDHPALAALGNSAMSRQTILESLISKLEHCGNAYAEVVRDGSGRPVEVWPLANHIRPVREGRTIVYEVSTKDGVQRVPAERILHLRFGVLSPDGITGANPCAILAEDLTAAERARDVAGSFLGNGMMPSGILKHPATLTSDAKTSLARSWQRSFQGAENAGSVVLLDEGFQYEPIAIDAEKSQLLQSREFAIRDAARIWNLPSHKIGDTTKSSYASLEQENLSFLTQTLLPRIRRLEAELNRALLSQEDRKRYGFRFELDAFLRAATRDRYESYAKATGGTGWATINEIRALEDLPPLPDGDTLVLMPGASTLDNNNGDSAVVEE